jgi:cytochrome c2
MKRFVYILCCIGPILGCNPKNAEVVEENAPFEVPAPVNNIEEGEKLFAANCVKCHALKDPKNFTAEEWKEIVPRMAVKAKIDTDTENKILEYVLANAK